MSKINEFLQSLNTITSEPHRFVAQTIAAQLRSEVVPQNMIQGADELRHLDELKKVLAAASSAVEELLGVRDEQLFNDMFENEMQRFTRNGKTFYRTSKVFVSRADGVELDSDELVEWLEQNGRGNLAQRKVNGTSFAAAVREMMKDEDGEYDESLLPEGAERIVQITTVPRVGMMKG